SCCQHLIGAHVANSKASAGKYTVKRVENTFSNRRAVRGQGSRMSTTLDTRHVATPDHLDAGAHDGLDLGTRVETVAQAAAQASATVDAQARFPEEAISAARKHRLM